MEKFDFKNFIRKYGTPLGTVLIFIIFSVVTDGFFSKTNLMNLLRQMSMLTIVAFGFTFVSIPDFINKDKLSKEEEVYANKVLTSISNQKPDFVLIPGDMVMGRWYLSSNNVYNKGNRYYKEWIRRFKKHNLKYYTAIGDHELGDLPAINLLLQGYLLDDFVNVYNNNFNNPDNGPQSLKNRVYYFIHKNTLFVTIQTFQIKGWFVHNTLSDNQINWLKNVLGKYKNDVDNIIVQGHLPVLPIKSGYKTSRLTVHDNTNSTLWQVMVNNGVDLYLAGEFHTTSIKERDGITQVVTGGIMDKKPIGYVVIDIKENIQLEIKNKVSKMLI